MKAALAKFRGKTEDLAPRVTRQEAKAKEAKWLQRHTELEAKLRALTRSKSPFSLSDPSDVPSDVLKPHDHRKIRDLEDQLRIVKARNDHLETTNKSLTLLLVEKDALVTRYMNELLTLQHSSTPYTSQTQEFSTFQAALEDLKNSEEVLEEWPASRPNGPIGKSSLFDYPESRNSLISIRNSGEMRLSKGEILEKTGSFGEERWRNEAEKWKNEGERWRKEVEKYREMLQSAEKEVMREREDKETAVQELDRLNEEIKTLKMEGKMMSQVKSELAEAKIQVEALQSQLDSHSNPFSPAQDPSTMQAIQQLSLMILSKDKSTSLDSHSKSLVHSVFGENFVNLVNAYELKVAKLEEEIKDLREIYRVQLGKHVKDLEVFLEILTEWVEMTEEDMEDFGGFVGENIGKYRELMGNIAGILSETKLAYEEQGVQSMRSSDYSSPIKKTGQNSDLEQLRTKLSIQTSENVNLLQKIRSLQSKETQLNRLKQTVNEVKAEQRKTATENEKLKQDLTQALSANTRLAETVERLEFRVRTDLDVEDAVTWVQTQAAVIEELMNQQNTQLEDFEDNLDL